MKWGKEMSYAARAKGICSGKSSYYHSYFPLSFLFLFSQEFLFAFCFVLFCWGSGFKVRFLSACCFQVLDYADVTLGLGQLRPLHPGGIGLMLGAEL